MSLSETPRQTLATVEPVEKLRLADLHDLCDAAEAAVVDGGGFGWVEPPDRNLMERYWRGVLLVPDRSLFVGRLDGVIAGSIQLVRPPRNNEAQAHACWFTTAFVAPWARGHGLARMLLLSAESAARRENFTIINLDVRESQTRSVTLFESLGYRLFGRHPLYARVRGRFVAGFYYYKILDESVLKDTDLA